MNWLLLELAEALLRLQAAQGGEHLQLGFKVMVEAALGAAEFVQKILDGGPGVALFKEQPFPRFHVGLPA